MSKWTWRPGIAGLMGLSLLSLLSVDASADPPDPKARREIRIIERDLDDLLIDSPNWLVPGRDNARGYYVPGHGLILSFEASLVSRGYRGGDWRWLTHWDDDDWDEDDDEDDDDEDDRKDRRTRRGREEEREARRYERGKEELREFLADYGDELSFLNSGENVELVAYLGDSDLFWEKDLTRLIMRVSATDLKSGLSEDAAATRIVVEEY